MRGRTAYSCGGSHGIGPLWVRRTVFPFDPLVPLHAGNRHNTTSTPLEGAGSRFRQGYVSGPGITDADMGDARADLIEQRHVGVEHDIAGHRSGIDGLGVVIGRREAVADMTIGIGLEEIA